MCTIVSRRDGMAVSDELYFPPIKKKKEKKNRMKQFKSH